MQVYWTESARQQLKHIYLYFRDVASTKIANDIKSQIFLKTRILKKHPEAGQLELNTIVAKKEYRYLVSGNYKIIYKTSYEHKIILILAVFDTRQNPDKMENI